MSATALCRRVARIVGDESSAAEALKQLRRRRELGHDVTIYLRDGFWIVGPKLETLQ